MHQLTIGSDVIQTGPFEEQLTRGDIKFCRVHSAKVIRNHNDHCCPTLNNSVDNPLLLRLGAVGGEVPRHRLVDLDQARLLVDDVELVLVDKLVVAGTKLADGLVVLVHQSDMAMAVSVSRVVVALEAEENVLAAPAGGLEIGRPDAVDAVSGPNQIAVVAQDVRPGLAGPMLLGGGVGQARERCDEEITLLDVGGGGNGDVEPGRRKIRPRAVLPIRGCETWEHGGGCDEAGSDGFHGGRMCFCASVSMIKDSISSIRYIHLCEVHKP